MAKKKEDKKDKKSIDDILKAIEKDFGQGSVMKLDGSHLQDVEIISTGCISLDHITGVGGVPKGRITEIYGSESSGKTTLALHIVASAQQCGGVAAFIDAEHSMDPKYAQSIGVSIGDLIVSQPDNGEQALEIVEKLVASNMFSVVVIDSVAALVPRAELEGMMGDSHMGLQARLMSQACRKLSGVIKRTNTCVVFINQVREKIGVVFGSPLVTPGGRALKFYSSMRMQISRIGAIKDETGVIGNKTKVKIVKNKVASPFKETEFEIIYGKGISRIGDLITLAETHGIIDRSGSWYSYKNTKIGQGFNKAVDFFEADGDLAAEVETRVLEALHTS